MASDARFEFRRAPILCGYAPLATALMLALSPTVGRAQAGVASPAASPTTSPAAPGEAPAAASAAARELPEVRVRERLSEPARERASIGGLGDAPVAETPQAISIIRTETLRDFGVQSLSGAIRTETSASDAYNTLGYIESIQVRGFLLNNAENYRRDGLKISNHAPIAWENKERMEILKGVSGIQSGTSTPGGLVDYVLKRPTATPLNEVFLGLSERGSVLGRADFGGRVGEGGLFGYRVNLAAEHRQPMVDDAPGSRNFISGFFDLRLPRAIVLEAEFERNDSKQFSVPGFQLLDTNGDGVADTLPPPLNTRINLGAQPWAQPFESLATAWSLRFRQALSERWLWGVRYGQQLIKTDDRLAFPDGCSAGPVYLYPGFCGNYDFDVYDYRSNNERREAKALDAYVRGEFATGPVRHELGAGAVQNRYSERADPMQAYNFVGISNVFNPVALPPDPTPTVPNVNANTRSNEFWVNDAMRFGGIWSLWVGARHTQLNRSSVRTDGTDAVSYGQSFTTPWAALGAQPWAGGFVYLSGGEGVQSEVVPNRPQQFVNYGQALPAFKSRQLELGLKQVVAGSGLATATLFRIDMPMASDVAQDDGRVLRVAGGREARHQGLELGWAGRVVPSLALQAQATFLDARTTESPDPALVGKRTTNVAPFAFSALAAWDVPGVPGLTWNNRLYFSGHKPVNADNSIELPTYWQWDTSIAYRQRLAGLLVTWRAGLDNVFDRRYWRDAPTQYWGGTYLFPAMPITARASVQVAF